MQAWKEIDIPTEINGNEFVKAVALYEQERNELTGLWELENIIGLSVFVGGVEKNGDDLLKNEWYYEYTHKQITERDDER